MMVLTAYKVPIPISENRKKTAFPTPAELIETVLYLPNITTSAKPIKTKPNCPIVIGIAKRAILLTVSRYSLSLKIKGCEDTTKI
jgi:hypothetical protein